MARYWPMVVMSLSLYACGHQDPAAEKIGPNAIVPLKTLRTGDVVTAGQNAVHLKGSGSDTQYKVTYKFNSGAYTAFRLISAQQISSCNGGSIPETKYSLGQTGDASPEEISVNDISALEANKNYELVLTAGAHECKQLELNYEVVAWADAANPRTANPQIARTCSGQDPAQQLVFFVQQQPMTAYSTAAARSAFVNTQTYCGENVNGADPSCGVSLSPGYETATCVSRAGGQNFKLAVSFDMSKKQVSVTCAKDEKPSYNATFTACTEQILDATAVTPRTAL